ncbi:helix-turn-helix transcriptional regulator [Rossellomorea sp. AcN35-11]|nr:helix-turn-helix transcriptional regulator [Rossellomorea aquimaris]WJV29871.1 helix-turn-helix transcriptional regulator [Rossellomorea sp. AcN35-11]
MEDQEIYGKCLGLWLKIKREELGFTQADVSANADISEKTLSMIERGERSPGSFTLFKIANAMNFSLDQLNQDVYTCMNEVKNGSRTFSFRFRNKD